MSSAVALFAARVVVLVLLYMFLYLVVRALRRDLRGAAGAVMGGQRVDASLGLELIDPGQTALPVGEVFAVRDPLMIGRASANDIALDDDWISAQHVRLRRKNGAWLAEDLGSTNGTRVNGNALASVATVRPGDVLDLGRVKFKVVGPG